LLLCFRIYYKKAQVMSQQSDPQSNLIERLVKSRPGNIIIKFLVIPTIILAVLFLPPISLNDRLLTIGYQPIGAAGARVQTSDGALVTFSCTCTGERAWVRVEAVNPTTLPNETGSDSLQVATKELPDGLALVGPLYHIQARGQGSVGPVKFAVPIPDTLRSTQNLDLYAWDGQSWGWLPSRIIGDKTVIEAEVDSVPDAVAVLESSARAPAISVDLEPDASLPAKATEIVAAINLPGFEVDSDGKILGETATIPATIQRASIALIPTIHNGDGLDETALNPIDDILAEPTVRRQHVEAIAELVQANDFQGVDLDYQGFDPNLRREFSLLLSSLRRALPSDTKISVRVPLPRQLSTGAWDTGGYDWQAIGRTVDVVKLPMLPDPDAFTPGGQMEAMLDWAVGQVDRSKLQLLLHTGNSEWVEGTVRPLTDQEALEKMVSVTPLNLPPVIDPGQAGDFTLTGLPASTGIQFDRASGTYWYAYLDEENRHHTIFLANVANLTDKLRLVRDYSLYGVAVQGLTGQERDQEILEIVRDFQAEVTSPDERRYQVAWQVENGDGEIITEESVDLSRPGFTWTAPEPGGSYEVAASILADQVEVARDSLAVLVATVTPTPSPTPTRQPTATPAAAVSANAPAQPKPAAPPPPAVEPVNVPFGYGIQTDPRGDAAANIGHIRALGFDWVKFQMPWKDVESSGPGNYNWGEWDQLVNAYSANGIKILLSIPKAPDWARPFDDDKSVEGPPQDPFLYAQFAGIVADRYRGKVQAMEIWNEQNLWYEAGGMGRINAANYVQLLQMSYQGIKSVNPDMIVVSGALTPAGTVGEAAVDDIEYLNQMYANGVKGFFDALGGHPSGYNCPATADWRSVQDPTATSFRGPFDNRHHSWCFRGTMEGYREVMVVNGDGGKAIVPTEFGWAVSGNPQPGYEYARDNTPEEQAQWIVEAYQMAKNWGWVGPMFLWNLDYGVTAPGTELANFGILNTPAYGALANMPK
jgi:spore germination protein YaaH